MPMSVRAPTSANGIRDDAGRETGEGTPPTLASVVQRAPDLVLGHDRLVGRDSGADAQPREALSHGERTRLPQPPQQSLVARLALAGAPQLHAQCVLLGDVLDAILLE